MRTPRHRRAATALARGLAAAAVAAGAGCGSGSDENAPDRVTFTGPPYLGVACSVPNSVACDRVGLYVRLADSARRVRATIGERRLELSRADGGPDSRGDFEGFLARAGLTGGPLRVDAGRDRRWNGTPRVSVPVWLDVTYSDGQRRSRRIRVRLSPGYG